jgi:Tfp pilus assembly protein PilO
MLTRKKLTITVLVCFGIVGLASAALFDGSTNERDQMNSNQNELSETLGIPQIDASPPSQTETATFSLG